jgi:hypothetical protein
LGVTRQALNRRVILEKKLDDWLLFVSI